MKVDPCLVSICWSLKTQERVGGLSPENGGYSKNPHRTGVPFSILFRASLTLAEWRKVGGPVTEVWTMWLSVGQKSVTTEPIGRRVASTQEGRCG